MLENLIDFYIQIYSSTKKGEERDKILHNIHQLADIVIMNRGTGYGY